MPRKALIHQIEARERRGRWFGALAILLAISLLGSGWIGLFSFLGANSAFGTFEEVKSDWVPDTRSMELNLPNLSRVSRIYAESGELLAELHDGRNSEPIPYSEMPPLVVQAILAAEDKDFFEHDGVDFSAIASAVIDYAIRGVQRGGSTVTQQVVKNAFVGNEITLERKVNEAFVSAELERRFPKERILEFYINSVYFGGGAYGIKAAAEEFYGKELPDIELHEAAALAVLIRNPTLYNPRIRPESTLERRNRVLETMVEKEWITDAEAAAAEGRPLGVIDSSPRRGEADHVVAEVKRQLLNDPAFAFLGATGTERKRAIFGCPADDVACEGGGGLQIITSIDLGLQKKANEILASWMPLPPYEENLANCIKIFPDETEEFLATYAQTHSCSPTGAIAMVDNYSGAVKVMASGLPFDFSQFDLAVQGRRNTGSAFKPFGAVAALENGKTMGHRYSGQSPIEIECPSICSGDSNIWRVSNAGASLGVITLDEATYRSTNVVYAQLAVEVGPDNIVDAARRMGIRDSSLTPVPSIVLGTSEVSTLEMASAFTNFATNGLWSPSYLIAKIVDFEGNVVYEHESQPEQTIDPAVAAAVRRSLIQVPTSSGTAARADIGRAQGGKTGTHQQYLDAWYVGFTPEYSAAVWVGYEVKQQPMSNIVINGQRYQQVFGGSVPAPIWAEFMRFVLDGVPETSFPADPANIEDFLVPPKTRVPSVVGLSRAAAIEATLEAKLTPRSRAIPSLEPAGRVVRQSLTPGALVDEGTPLTLYVSNGEVPAGNLPNLVGLTVEEAQTVLNAFELESGVQLTMMQQSVPVENPGQVGKIVATDPASGTRVGYGEIVTVQVGVAA